MATQAQDIIMKKNGVQLVAKITKIESDSIYYRYFSDVDGPAFALSRQDVAQVQFIEATTTLQPEGLTYTDEQTSISDIGEMRLQAQRDAKAYFRPRGVFWTTMGATVLNPAAGLVTGTVVSVVPPNIESDYNPNHQLLKNEVYREAYQKQARKRKIGTAAAGFGAGAAVLSMVYMVVTMSLLGGG
ncbi:hypothetical protein [Pontibacter chitinilyticus]|uniref:hypothetical protein n=1 Tax=Pontibacter chitinilyticus TaxID=2674989 RepID=UPI00321AF217